MNVVCIATSQIPSDTANSIQVMKACQAIAQIGHKVTLLVPGRMSFPWEHLASHYGLRTDFQIEWLPANPRLRRYDFALAAVRRGIQHDPELIYTWALQASIFGLLHGYPVCLELHGPPEGAVGPHLFRFFLRLRGQKRLLLITQALVKILKPVYGPALSHIETIIAPNGVDLARFRDLPDPDAARRELDLPENLTVGYTGHLYPGRGMDLLSALAHRFPEIHFLWVGGRPDDVERWQKRLRLAEITNVTLLGFIENRTLPRYQAAMDILLMPYERVIAGSGGGNSADYCSPMKMFEYLASGRAIISSDLPPLREVLGEDLALLCPPEEPDLWAAALEALASDPDRRNALGGRAQQAAVRYTWQARARKSLAGFPAPARRAPEGGPAR